MQGGGALRATVCYAQATQTASSPDLIQVGLRAGWSPAATGWGVHDWLLALWAMWGASAGANRSAPWAGIRYTLQHPGAMRNARKMTNDEGKGRIRVISVRDLEN